MQIQDIRQKIRRGDYQLIAEMTGYEPETVRMQIRGHRTLKEKVLSAAIKVIESRENLINQN